MKNILTWISAAYALAWAIVVAVEPALWPVAMLGFIQNIAFTFVSRGRNSGSLGYHLTASIFSNGIYAALLFVSIDQVSQAKSMPFLFLAVYTLATMSGSIFAHWLALRIEKGKGKSVQEDKFGALARRVAQLEANAGRPYNETLIETMTKDGRTLRIWVDPEVQKRTNTAVRLQGLLNDPGMGSESTPEVARLICERLEANAVQCGSGTSGAVYYREWP